MVHRRGADRAQNYIAPIEHRELNDRPIEVVTPDLALLQRHCEHSISEGFDCATSIGRCRLAPLRLSLEHHSAGFPFPQRLAINASALLI